ncbi:phage terminase large subunit [Paenibacillus amylolyticus]|uniref:phage terminase large subunit n=1 Tax=Paenibacillus amylolyticus TaxID=1451 RepID=UPI00211B27D6|nr:phage terminase large subunit [Paenibacillus amylolyticus]
MSLTAAEEMELIALLEVETKEQAKVNYYDYIKYAHDGLYKDSTHGLFIAEIIQDAIDRKKDMIAGKIPMEDQYIGLSIPPRHGKSMTITETLPSYYLGHFPNDRIIEGSYNTTFASKFGKKNLQKMRRYGEELFGLQVSPTTKSSSDWDIDGTRGGMISRGILAGVTGEGADLMIIDDPIKNREEADSQVYRDKMWSEWIDSFSTRLHPGAICIFIMTRWHEDDLIGRLQNPEYGQPIPMNMINLPLEAEEGDLLGRDPGEPLWPERYSHNFIESRKKYPSSFNALYQGRPTSQEGNMLKRQWWKYYDVLPPVASKLISVDAAFKDSDDSDYVVIQVWGKNQANMYLIDQVRAKMNFMATVKSIMNMHTKHPDAAWKLIEDKANGSAIISTLHSQIGGIIPVNPEGGKVARVNAVSAFIESGNVFIPRQAEWIHDFVEEAASFPNGKHDDQVDAMSQALHRFIYFNGNMPEEQRKSTPFPFWTEEPSEGEYVGW